MKVESQEYVNLFQSIRQSQRLKSLNLTNVSTKPEVIEVLNKHITKDNNFQQLTVCF